MMVGWSIWSHFCNWSSQLVTEKAICLFSSQTIARSPVEFLSTAPPWGWKNIQNIHTMEKYWLCKQRNIGKYNKEWLSCKFASIMKLPAVFATIVAVLVMFTFQKMSKLSFDLFFTFHNLPCCPAREIQLECQGNTVDNICITFMLRPFTEDPYNLLGPTFGHGGVGS